MCDRVLFVERSGECMYAARLRTWMSGAKVKASVNRTSELHGYDPKPGDLPMIRLKWR